VTRAQRPIAWLTGVVAVGTLAVSIAALASPGLMQLMTRNVAELRTGQWWRIVTPVLVQPDGWGQLVFNLLGVTVVGVALERRTSRVAWLLTYLVGGVGGIAATMFWHPSDRGGGSSDAVAALIGALTVLLVAETCGGSRRRPRTDWLAQLYGVFFAGYLSALDVGGVWWSVVVGNVTIIGFVLARRSLSATALSRVCLAVIVVAGVVMAIAQDGHGFGLIAGAAGGSVILLRRSMARVGVFQR
jgi:membrane associated rhomboid family serine protease